RPGRSQTDRARGLHRDRALLRRRQHLGAATTPPPAPDEDEPPAKVPGASPADLLRFVDQFGGRAGVHARQWLRGAGQRAEVGWSPVHTPLVPDLVQAHLDGGLTLGSYLVRHGDRCAQLVLDVDASPEALERAWGHPERARALREELHRAGLLLRDHLRERGLHPLLVDSGFKGRHLWCLLDGEPTAADVRAAGHALLHQAPPLPPGLSVEVFPKQDHVPAGGLGNLVKLPLGVHLRSGRRSALLDEAGQPLPDPWPTLRALRRTPLPAGRARSAPAPVPLPEPEPALPADAADPAPPFCEADFDAMPRLVALRRGCPVLREVIDQALSTLRIEAEAAVVLEHSLGHLAEGVEAVNYLGRICGGTPLRMGSPHRGSVISCARIRQRIPHVAQSVPCTCKFEGEHRYPHPLVHLGGAELQPEPPPALLEDRVAALGRLEARLRRLESERDGLRRHVADRLARLPGGRLVAPEGTWTVEDVDGLPVVRFEGKGPA
ncbi:hypothetical protein L6R53_33095, partial [Myxococcota bacterium]|nr:hypothetical protein [Myxococcota bacterium]